MIGALDKPLDPSDFNWLEAEAVWGCELRLRSMSVVRDSAYRATYSDPHFQVLVSGSRFSPATEHLSALNCVLGRLADYLDQATQFLIGNDVDFYSPDVPEIMQFRHSPPIAADVLSIEACDQYKPDRVTIVLATDQPDEWANYEVVIESGHIILAVGG